MKLTKQRCFDPRDPDYDGPDDDYESDHNEYDGPDLDEIYSMDNPADDYIMSNYEEYVNRHF